MYITIALLPYTTDYYYITTSLPTSTTEYCPVTILANFFNPPHSVITVFYRITLLKTSRTYNTSANPSSHNHATTPQYYGVPPRNITPHCKENDNSIVLPSIIKNTMDNVSCTTIVLVLLWLSLCCQALGSLVALVDEFSTTTVLFTTTPLSTLLLGVCLWQCKKAGYLLSPMTWYHWALLVLLMLLQVMAVVLAVLKLLQPMEDLDEDTYSPEWIYPIYGVAVLLVFILGGTLYCGWKCNLFCRPCCKSQYVCYGSAIVVVLVLLVVLGVTASMVKYQPNYDLFSGLEWVNEILTIRYLDKIVVPCTQCYTTAVLWITILKLPYTVPEVITLMASALAVASILAVATPITMEYDLLLSTALADSPVLRITTASFLLALHVVALGITLYCLEYKGVFHWPKDYMCFGVLAAVVILVALVAVVIVMVIHIAKTHDLIAELKGVEFALLAYSLLLMVPVFWYAYRCGLLTWRWNSCLSKQKSLKATDTAENTVPDTDVAKES
ncbi:putative integral membrane protein [Babesia bovis T2Bo]|uniref:Uncharacterized protein n=1 Tax=Babesia bovis TaxID=5865 RepID=A7AUZ5_BABBO|nr:putative integral membrane protein [Babesia bovis T2Bo]EDO05621.1 putative integral membrane protein [Babesia bovis T2Bo]|eukprot:XP_001609189.1 hypothetical protein [Babesia bovis T2Bo]